MALFVSLGGPGYARQIIQSIDGHKIKTGTIDANRLSKGARRALTGKTGPRGRQGIQGPRGADGQAGSAGPPGTAVAYARINVLGGAVTASKNITADQVSLASGHPGIVCFHDLNFTVTSMVATPVATSVDPNANRVFVAVNPNATAAGCPASSPPFANDAVLSAWDASTTGAADTHEVEVWFE